MEGVCFFGNLILGEQNELKSRYLLVGLTEEGKRKLLELSEGKVGQGGHWEVLI